MATEGGPKLVSDGLVLALDAANDKSFRGEPTENLNQDPLHKARNVGETINLSSWGGDTGYGEFVKNDSPVGGGFAFINHNTSDPAGSGGTYTDFPSQRYTLENGKTYTRSWYMKASKKQTISGHICSSNKDSDNTYIVGGSVEVTTTWKRYYHTFTYTGPTSSDWQFRHINYKNNSIWIANVQLEEKDHPTRFVDGARGATVDTGGGWTDLKGGGNNGELVNSIGFESDNLGGLRFDGVDNYIDFGGDITISPSFQGWTCIYTFNTDEPSKLQHFNSAEYDEFNANWLSIKNSKLAVWNRSPGYWKYGETIFTSNRWYQATFIMDQGGANMRFYVNGKIEGGSYFNNTWNSDYSLLKTKYIGRYCYQGNYSRYFSGNISMVQMFDRPLSEEEVKTNFNSVKSRYNL